MFGLDSLAAAAKEWEATQKAALKLYAALPEYVRRRHREASMTQRERLQPFRIIQLATAVLVEYNSRIDTSLGPLHSPGGG